MFNSISNMIGLENSFPPYLSYLKKKKKKKKPHMKLFSLLGWG